MLHQILENLCLLCWDCNTVTPVLHKIWKAEFSSCIPEKWKRFHVRASNFLIFFHSRERKFTEIWFSFPGIPGKLILLLEFEGRNVLFKHFVWHFHHHTFLSNHWDSSLFSLSSRYLCLHLGSLHPRIFEIWFDNSKSNHLSKTGPSNYVRQRKFSI